MKIWAVANPKAQPLPTSSASIRAPRYHALIGRWYEFGQQPAEQYLDLERDYHTLVAAMSGAGKSTVARLSASWPVLSDDLVLIERMAGGYLACGVPFRGNEWTAPRLNRRAPLAGSLPEHCSRSQAQPMVQAVYPA